MSCRVLNLPDKEIQAFSLRKESVFALVNRRDEDSRIS
jgi:hypothetical protein